MIKKRVVISTVKAFKTYIENDEPVTEELEDIKLYGSHTIESATKVLKKKYPNLVDTQQNLLVSKVDTLESLYEMSLDDFIKHATFVPQQQTL